MPTQATIAITPGSGQLLDAVSLVIGPNTVVRETMVIADPSNATQLAGVTAGGALSVSDAVIEACITANILAVALPAAQITTLTPPSASAIGTAVASDLLIGTQVAGSSLPVALPTATITTLTPPSAAAIAAAIVANPPAITGTVSITGTVGVTQSTSPWVVSNGGTFAVQASQNGNWTTRIVGNLGVVLDAVLGATKPANVLQVGGNDGTNAYAIPLAAGGASVAVSGTVSIGSGPFTVVGNLTNNNAIPSTTNLGVLSALANAAAPTWNEGDQVLLSEDLAGNLRVLLHAETTKVIGTVNQGTAPWIVAGGGTAGSPGTAVLTVQGIGSGTALPVSIAANVSTIPGLPTTAATVKTNTLVTNSGWTSLVAGSGSTTIRLWRLVVSTASAVNVGLGDGSTISEGPYYLTADGSIVWDISGEPWYVGAAGAALEVNLSGAANVTVTTWTTQS